MLVQPHRGASVHCDLGSRKAGLEWVDLSFHPRPSGYSRGTGPTGLGHSSCGQGLGRRQGRGRVWPGANGTPHGQQGARTDGPAGLGRECEAPARREIRAQACRLQASRGRTHSPGMGEARQAPLPLERNTVGRASFPASAGARLPRGRAACYPPPGALPLCLSAAPLLPDEWLLAGNWMRSWGAALLGAACRLRVPPAAAGAAGDVLTSSQRKKLDASKVLFTAGLCLLRS